MSTEVVYLQYCLVVACHVSFAPELDLLTEFQTHKMLKYTLLIVTKTACEFSG